MAIVNSVINFIAAYKKEYAVSVLAAWMPGIVKDLVLSVFLSGNSPQPYHCYIRVAKFLLQRLSIFNNNKNIARAETGSRMLDILHLDDGTLF